MDGLIGQLERHLGRTPRLGKGVYVARTAVVVGDVTLGDHSSVWYGAVLRGDINRIEIGHHTNVQDNAVLHLADEHPCLVGNWVTIGHSANVHACTIGDECLIGMGATVLDGAVIGEQCLIGAHALVTPGTVIPAGSMVLGAPAKVVRALTAEERAGLRHWAQKYVVNGEYCLRKGSLDAGGAVRDNAPSMPNVTLSEIERSIRNVPDFPKPGIQFKDITPVLADGRLFGGVMDHLLDGVAPGTVDKVVGIDARGFIFGAAAAARLGCGFVPVRKKGKLPWTTHEQSYDLEYGSATVAIHVDAVHAGERVLLLDDLLATGGTAAAAMQLLEKLGARVVGVRFLIELAFLNGRERLGRHPVHALITY